MNPDLALVQQIDRRWIDRIQRSTRRMEAKRVKTKRDLESTLAWLAALAQEQNRTRPIRD